MLFLCYVRPLQFGGRLENTEEVLQSVFGHDGSAGNSFLNWVASLLQKAQGIFKSASEDFLRQHEREKRSYDITDVKNFLRKVNKIVENSLQNVVYMLMYFVYS